MRVWDIEPKRLCNQHLLGEHRELHAIWSILTNQKKGYSRHPETLRWKGRLSALYQRHDKLVAEMKKRGFNHASPLDRGKAKGRSRQDIYVDTPAQQKKILKAKPCPCLI